MALTIQQMPINGIPTYQYKPNNPSIAWIVDLDDAMSLKTNRIVKSAKMLTARDNIVDTCVTDSFF